MFRVLRNVRRASGGGIARASQVSVRSSRPSAAFVSRVAQPPLQAQHSSWMRRLIIGAASATTAVAVVSIYKEAFPSSRLLDLVEDRVTPAKDYSEMTVDLEIARQAVTDLKQAGELVDVIGEVIDAGGTTLFAESGCRNGVVVLEEVSDSEAAYYDKLVKNSEIFRQRIEELKELSGKMFPVLAQRVIARCTERGSYSLLKILSEEAFGLGDLLRDNVVLNHPRAELIETYLDKFHKLGLLEQKHMPLILAMQQQWAMDGEEALAQIALLPADPTDAIDWMQALMISFRELRQSAKQVSRDFEHTVLLPVWNGYVESTSAEGSDTLACKRGDYNPLSANGDVTQEHYDRFFGSLKKEADGLRQPVNAHGILCGWHFTCFTTQVEKGDDGRFTVRLLYVDSMPYDLSSFSGSNLLPAIKRTFGEDVKLELYSSIEYTQSRGVGCSYHAPFTLERLRELPDWLERYGSGYADMPREERVWAYLQGEGANYSSDTVVHYFDDTSHYQEAELTVLPQAFSVTWHGVVLPLHFAENKESFDKRENVSATKPVTREQEAPFRVVSRTDVGDIHAQQGLAVNMERGSPRFHQQPLPVGIYLHSAEPFSEALAKKTLVNVVNREDGSMVIKRRNRGVDAYREHLRTHLGQILMSLPPEELDRLGNRYSLEKLEAAVDKKLRHQSMTGLRQHSMFAVAEVLEETKSSVPKREESPPSPDNK